MPLSPWASIYISVFTADTEQLCHSLSEQYAHVQQTFCVQLLFPLKPLWPAFNVDLKLCSLLIEKLKYNILLSTSNELISACHRDEMDSLTLGVKAKWLRRFMITHLPLQPIVSKASSVKASISVDDKGQITVPNSVLPTPEAIFKW